ncbi:MAG TPA: hypothetical protein VNO70_09045 [Blastocatellia bacterium]|nr:hypothetical protein [Blastocatellia bacterium]
MRWHKPYVRKPLFITVICFVCSGLAVGQTLQAAAPSDGYQLDSAEGKFKVKFPDKPQPSAKTIEGTNLMMNSHVLSQGPFGYFEVGYIDYPGGFGDPDIVLSGAIKGGTLAVTAQGGKVTSDTSIQYGECKGREAIIDGPGSNYTHVRAFLSGQRLYFLVYAVAASTAGAREVSKRFLDSFEVVGGCINEISPVEAPSSEVRVSTIAGEKDAMTGWRKIAPANDGFSVLMPTDASVKEQQVQVNPFPLTTRAYESESGNAFYAVMASGIFPDKLFTNEAFRQLAMDSAIHTLEKEIKQRHENVTVTFVRNLKVGAHPGREYTIIAGSPIGRLQCFAVSGKLYFFMALDSAQDNHAANFTRFFSSIKLIVD